MKIHYAFIAGENDAVADVEAVCDAIRARDLAVHVNVVRYNPPADRRQANLRQLVRGRSPRGPGPTPWAVLPNYTAFNAATRGDGDAVALSLLDGLFTGTSSELQANTPVEQLAPLTSLDDQPIVLGLHSADLTGDGVDDVVLEQLPGGGGHTLAILDGAALGDVLYQQEASAGIARATEIGDLDGDGREDVVTHFVDDDRSSILYLLSSGL